MDKINEFVTQARKNGQSDDQIRQSLIAMKFTQVEVESILQFGKLPAGTTARPTTIVAPTPAIKSPSTLLIIGVVIFLLILISLSVFSLWFVMQNQQKQKTSPVPIAPPAVNIATSSSSLPKVVNKSLIAYVQDASPSASLATVSGSVVIFDLDTQKRLQPNIENSLSPILGSWSPTGNYLPILGIRPSLQTSPIWLFDSQTDQVKKIVSDINSNMALRNGGNSFLFQSFWKDPQTFVYGPEYISSSPPPNLITLDLNGKIGTISSQVHSFTLRNSKIIATYSFSFNSLGRGDNLDKITLEGKNLDFKPVGTLIGTVNNNLVSLDSPKPKTANDLVKDKAFQAQLAKAKNKAAIQKLTDDYLAPKGDSIVHIYDSTGKEINNFALPTSNWFIISVQIRNPKGTLIVHQTDAYLHSSNSQFVEIDPSRPTQQRIIAQVISENGEESKLTGYGSFGLSPNGTWLVFYEPSADKNSKSNYSISAINLDSRAKQTICLDRCSNLRVFNPEALTYR